MDKMDKQEELFNRWRMLGRMVSSLGNSVQNDLDEFPLTPENIQEFHSRGVECRDELYALFAETKKLIKAHSSQ